MRGGVAQKNEAEEDEEKAYIFFYGCEPSKGVNADSNISVDFFVELKKQMKSDGSVMLP